MSCATTRSAYSSEAPSNQTPTQIPESMTEAPSIINLPLHLEIQQLENLLNEQLGDSLYTGGRSEEDRRLQMQIRKGGDIKLQIRNGEISYRVPLDLDIAYDITLGTAKANGKIELDFTTTYQIDEGWHLLTQTDLVEHQWIERPRLQLGIVNLPIGMLSDFVINSAEATVERTIDQLASRYLALDQKVLEAWNKMHQPVLLSEEHQAWLRVQPLDIQMTPLFASDERIEATLILKAQPRLFFGENPGPGQLTPFPAFRYASTAENDFNLLIGSVLTYEDAQTLAQEAVVGETYSSGRRSLTINGLRLYGEGNEVVVEVDASGSYNGTIGLSGVPRYNARRDRLEIDNLDYRLETRNFLHRTAAWLFKSRLKRTIQDQLNEQLTTNLASLHEQLKQELKERELVPGLLLKGDLEQLDLSGAEVVDEGIELQVLLHGELEIIANGLTQIPAE